MNALKNLWHDVLLVWTFFTRIPAPHFMTERKLGQALWALPLVGVVIAVVQASFLFVFDKILVLPPFVGVVLVILLPIVLTGALHWDGLADFFDGLGVGKDRRATVMRDSSVGVFGLLAVLGFFLLQIAAIISIVRPDGTHAPFSYDVNLITFTDIWLLFLAAAITSRAGMGLVWAIFPALDSDSQAKQFGRPAKIPQAILFITPIALVLIFSGAWLATIIFLLGFGVWMLLVRRSLSGVNGDVLGATQVVLETLIVVLWFGVGS